MASHRSDLRPVSPTRAPLFIPGSSGSLLTSATGRLSAAAEDRHLQLEGEVRLILCLLRKGKPGDVASLLRSRKSDYRWAWILFWIGLLFPAPGFLFHDFWGAPSELSVLGYVLQWNEALRSPIGARNRSRKPCRPSLPAVTGTSRSRPG